MTEDKSPYGEIFDEAIKGIVTARKCEHCGHHEIGITTDEGGYFPLRPGMTIEIVNQSEAEEEVMTSGRAGGLKNREPLKAD